MWLLFLLIAWGAACLSCAYACRTALAAAQAPDGVARTTSGSGQDREFADRHGPPSLTLYETAYLTGGPGRLADVALVSMAQQDRLLLAHTGWATVVDPVGRDAVERATLTAIGPEGQRAIPAVRGALDGSDAVRALAGRLVTAGLAQPDAARRDVGHAVRRLRRATAVVLLTAAAALWMTPPGTATGPMLAWFALPLVLTTGTWAMARVDVHPYTHWATAAGEHLVRRVAAAGGRAERHGGDAGSEVPEQGAGNDRDSSDGTAYRGGCPPGRHGGRSRRARRQRCQGHGRTDTRAALTALAVHGPDALADPVLRAALHSSGV
ncbi:TIGR04222 domain-containing membrane protein [Streptomyces sp. NPDC017993]|uniref:TIGR04222 domain-containing membrane protein n=1 Tax=Streptomyces sp. NPDC017993 TaxID=3365027 RepID=UPI00378732CF